MPRNPTKSLVSRADKKRLGAFYTDADVASVIARLTLSPLLQGKSVGPPAVLDPACGEGQLLVTAWRELLVNQQPTSLSDRVALATSCLFGVDVDPSATSMARRVLAMEILQDGDETAIRRLSKQLSTNIVVGNLLMDEGVETKVFAMNSPCRFDAVLMNPPFLNRRRQAKQFTPSVLNFWPGRFRTARGAFDLYVLFIERAWELLRDGGRCGVITPNKIATMNYAKPCRELLSKESCLRWLIDASDVPLFGKTDVWPLLFGFEKSVTPTDSGAGESSEANLPVLTLRSRAALADVPCLPSCPSPTVRSADKHELTDGWQLAPVHQFDATQWRFSRDLAVETRVPTVAAKDIADWHVGTPGFGAQRISKLLREDSSATADDIPFIVSGNIHRFQVNDLPMRFMKQRWKQPVLDAQHPKLTTRQQLLFTQPKLVVAGMGQRLRVAWDDRGCALGVQVYAATNLRVPPYYLLALLNSSLMTRIFRLRYAAKRMSDDYLTVHKAQLQLLPIRPFDAACPLQQQIVELSKARASSANQPPSDQNHEYAAKIDASIDSLVLQLYGVAEHEVP